MHARNVTLFGALCAALIASSTLATSGAGTGASTSPVRTETSGDAVANGVIALPHRAKPAPDVAPGSAAAPGPAAQESTPLGRPNGALSTRPVAADESSGRFLAALDPRRNDAVRIGGALVIVLGLLLLTRAGLKRAPGMLGGAGRPAGVVEILARYPVARGQSLIVLRMARRILLLHQAGTSMVTLSEVADAEEVAALLARMEAGSRSREAARFRSKLRDFEAEHDRVTAQDAAGSRNAPPAGVDRGEIVDLTRGSGRRLSLPGRRRLSA